MNQVLLGASFPFVVLALIYGLRGGRAGLGMLILGPIVTGMSAVWAVAPDLPRLFGMHDLYMRLSFDPRCNIFYWHYTIDQIEGDSPWYAVGLVLMAAAFLYAAWRELRRAEDG